MKYRKKPVVVEAVQFTQECLEAHLFDGAPLPPGLELKQSFCHPESRKVWSFTAVVETPGGFIMAVIGDWIIKGEDGEYYPCKDDIFMKTFVPAEAPGRRIVCAANRTGDDIILGVRHWDAYMHLHATQAFGDDDLEEPFEQGFLDNQGNFLSRTEAWKVAEAAGQIIRRVGGDTEDGGTLYSENLY